MPHRLAQRLRVRLFADAGHHQDVVVRAERHQKHEHQERQDELDAILAAQMHEDDRGQSEGG